ncbi:MAG: hypothetical protein OEY49_09000 [Candidatus Heimdallarchaeota archaeon]|nr:hypothetical protein [Candidatus Heimdallarchaeota archaeon]
MRILTYLYVLLSERLIFLVLGLVKLWIIISRLEVTAYVEFVAILSFTTIIAVLSRLGIEIYIKTNSSIILNSTSVKSSLYKISIISLYPFITIISVSLIIWLPMYWLSLSFQASILIVSGMIILLSLNGLIYEIILTIANSHILILSSFINVVLTTSVYFVFLETESDLTQFLHLFILVNILTLCLNCFFMTLGLKYQIYKDENQKISPQFSIKMIFMEIKFTFLYLITGLIIHYFPISYISKVKMDQIASIGLTFTLLELLTSFYKQVSNYILIKVPKDNNKIKEFTTKIIQVIILSNLIAILVIKLVLQNHYLIGFLNKYFSDFHELNLIISYFGYPMAIILFFTYLNEGVLINRSKLKILVLIRVILGSIMFTSIFVLLIFDSIIFVVLLFIIMQFFLSFTTLFLVVKLLSYNKYQALVIISTYILPLWYLVKFIKLVY